MAVYVNNEEKAENHKSSAYTLLLVGCVGLLLVLLYFFGIIRITGFNRYMVSGVMGTLFLLFIIMGLVSFKSASFFAGKAKGEINLTREITAWCKENLRADEIDASLSAEEDSSEALYFARTEKMKERITEKFMNLDQDYLERLTDELYDSIFAETQER